MSELDPFRPPETFNDGVDVESHLQTLNTLAIVGLVLCTLSLIFAVITFLVNLGVLFQGYDGLTSQEMARQIGLETGRVFFILLPLGMIYGNIQAMRLGKFKWARFAAILMSIPCCSPLVVLGMPVGIWMLVLFNKPGVKERFADLN